MAETKRAVSLAPILYPVNPMRGMRIWPRNRDDPPKKSNGRGRLRTTIWVEKKSRTRQERHIFCQFQCQQSYAKRTRKDGQLWRSSRHTHYDQCDGGRQQVRVGMNQINERYTGQFATVNDARKYKEVVMEQIRGGMKRIREAKDDPSEKSIWD